MAGEWSASLKPLHQPAVSRDLPETWHWIRLDDACEGVFDCPHSTPNLVNAGPLVVRSQDIITGVFRTEQAAHVSLDTYRERTSKAVPSHGDLLYSREGTYFGIAAEVPDRTQVCLGQRMVLIRPKADVLNFRFLRYWLNSPVMASHIHGYRDGSVAERLNLPTIRALPVAVPPIQKQRAIAHILGTLDDKIELNRRMNETLEAMARTLFKSWFVDFDPVHAKAEGHDPCLPQYIADLFPDSFEESELGEVPKGWGVGPLESVLVLQRGFDLPSLQRTPGLYPVLAASGPSGTHNEFMVRGPGVTTGRSGVLGKIFYVHNDFWPLNTSLWVKEFRHSTPAYAFYLLQGFDLGLFNVGSAVPTLNRNHVHNVSVLVPPLEVVEVFDRIATSCLKHQKHNEDQSRTLAALRDSLLPKLISGELRLKDL
jgi:type I restriction enzyme S subunit